MKKIELIEMAKSESVPDGHVITGYCNVDDCAPQVTCTRDKVYQESIGNLTDCNFAKDRTKTSCEHWHRVKSFEFKGAKS